MNEYKKGSFSQKSTEAISYVKSYDRKSPHFRMPILFSIVYILLFISVIIYKRALSDAENAYLFVAIIEIITVSFPPVIYLKARGEEIFSAHSTGFSLDKLIIILLGSVAMIFGAISLTILSSNIGITKDSISTFANFEMPLMPNRLSYMTFASITFALIPAVCEEFLCRGILYSEYEKYGTPVAIFVSSLMFSMMHFSLEKLPVYLFCGAMLGFLRAITGSVLSSVIAHFIYNMFVLFYQQFFGALTEQFSEFTLVFFISLGLCFITLFFMFGEADRIYNSYAKKDVYIERGYKGASLPSLKSTAKEFFTSPALILSVILYILFSIIL
jgi:membrane protease YdiL (CAAX protease family)